MRISLVGLVIVLGVSSLATETQAQVPFNNVNDPFFAYYSYYLPRQQAQAMSSGPQATIDAFAANQQRYAATNRNGMFDPNSSSFGSLDLSDDFSPSAGMKRKGMSAVGSGRFGTHGGNLDGLGPRAHYNRGLNVYYKDLRAGRGRNANASPVRGRGFSGGYGAASGLGGGLPGPR